MNYTQYKANGSTLEPKMDFIGKLQPLFLSLNVQFVEFKNAVHSGDTKNAQRLIDDWNDLNVPTNVRANIIDLIKEEFDQLRMDVKFNMYNNLLGGIKWIEQVIQRQINFAQTQMPFELKEYLKFGKLPLYPIRDTDEKNDINRKYLQTFAEDYLNVVRDFETAFNNVYPTYQSILPGNTQISDLTSHTPRIVLDYTGSNDNIIARFHEVLNIRFIKEIDLEDFKLHFSTDGFLPKFVWVDDDYLLYQLFLGLKYKHPSIGERTDYLHLKNDPYECIKDHFRSLTKEFTDNNNIKKNHAKSATHHVVTDKVKKITNFLEELHLA